MKSNIRDRLQPTQVWDFPVRLFHWLIVILMSVSWTTGELGGDWLTWHFRSGYAILALVLFRISWGFFGSHTARFINFIKGPRAMIAHLRHLTSRTPDFEIGHNPLGGVMVVVLLLMLLLQASTGLFANDDIVTTGPLAGLVDSPMSARLTSFHRLGFDVLLIFAGLHILAVLVYWVVFRHNLIKPMLTGTKSLPESFKTRSNSVSLWRAGIMIFTASVIVYGIVVWLPILAAR